MKSTVLLLILPFCTLLAGSWDVESWQYLNWKNWESGPYKLYTIAEGRLRHDISTFYYCRISENFAYRAHPNLDLEAHYSYIYSKGQRATQFRSTQRLEFELNPFLTVREGFTVKWRNRLELLKREDISHIQFVGRQRTSISFPVESCGRLTKITLYDELFYDFDTGILSQNRFVPLQLTFAIRDEASLQLFFMARNFYSFGEQKWYRSFVLGTEVGF